MSQFLDAIAPHGGELINRIATPEQRQQFLEQADSLPSVVIDERALSDLVMIAIGAFSPLTGFMEQADYDRVVESMHLANGLPWSIPVTLSVDETAAEPLEEGSSIVLRDQANRPVGILELTQKYRYDKRNEAAKVYLTEDEAHPGVKVVYEQGAINLAGGVWLLEREAHPQFPAYQLDP
ncbi:MAG: sulfate adenylyltransferase, partial [Microcoleus sp. SIO2G3]|nr:sulfate adenylyltransferase [Microcoleus sp. SIO2G3]